jgi:pimeloyl-ACP methyl ester carboxylesterase
MRPPFRSKSRGVRAQKEGIGLCLLHAFPVDARMWQPQIEYFGQALAVVAPNFPGFGGSAAGPETPTMELAADLVRQELDQRGMTRAVICGSSMGGYVALAFWERFRPRVAGLVFANTRAVADDEHARRERHRLAALASTDWEELIERVCANMVRDTAPTALKDAVEAMTREQGAYALAAALHGMAVRRDFTSILPNIDVPTLVITSRDELIPPDITKEMARLIPGARLATVPEAGHLPNMENPTGFNSLLEEYLVRCGVPIGLDPPPLH